MRQNLELDIFSAYNIESHFRPFYRCTLLNFKIMPFTYFVPKLFY